MRKSLALALGIALASSSLAPGRGVAVAGGGLALLGDTPLEGAIRKFALPAP